MRSLLKWIPGKASHVSFEWCNDTSQISLNIFSVLVWLYLVAVSQFFKNMVLTCEITVKIVLWHRCSYCTAPPRYRTSSTLITLYSIFTVSVLKSCMLPNWSPLCLHFLLLKSTLFVHKLVPQPCWLVGFVFTWRRHACAKYMSVFPSTSPSSIQNLLH